MDRIKTQTFGQSPFVNSRPSYCFFSERRETPRQRGMQKKKENFIHDVFVYRFRTKIKLFSNFSLYVPPCVAFNKFYGCILVYPNELIESKFLFCSINTVSIRDFIFPNIL